MKIGIVHIFNNLNNNQGFDLDNLYCKVKNM